MVSHIKSHRLVAFLIYSSLSIYASHGKNAYIIQMPIDGDQSGVYSLRCVVVVVLRFGEDEEERKSCFRVHAAL